MATTRTPTYVPRPMPTLGGGQQYLQLELASISQSIKSMVAEGSTNTASIAAHEAAWTAYTPTVAIPAGAGTATGRYKKIGKTVHIHLSVSVTSAGATLDLGLPSGVAPLTGWSMIVGRDMAVNGLVYLGLVGYPSSGLVRVGKYDNTFAVVAGLSVYLSGSFEAA